MLPHLSADPHLRDRMVQAQCWPESKGSLSCPKADMLISETCQPLRLKLLTVHTSHPAFCCLLPNLSLQSSEQSQTWRKFPLLLCPLPHTCSPSCRATSSSGCPEQPPSLFRDEEVIASVASPAWTSHTGLLFTFHAHSGCVPPLFALGMHVSVKNAVFLSVACSGGR